MAPGEGGGDGRNADYYEVLGVPESATGDDITRAYRRLARQHHPDHNPAAGSQRFQEITDAYDVIGDADRRARYDAERRRPGSQRRSGTGGGIRIPVRGPAAAGPRPASAPDRPVITLSVEEAAAGTIAVVRVTEAQPCSRCRGSGREGPTGPCPDCAGAGSVVRRTGQIPVRHICSGCAGRGRPLARACTNCDATGTTTTSRPLKVRVPPGVKNGATLRIRPREHPRSFEAVVRVV